MSKRSVGRPVIFKGNLRSKCVGMVRRHGNLLHALAALKEEGIKISAPTLRKYSRAAGVKLSLGRPRKAA
jgi:hypothetical protein